MEVAKAKNKTILLGSTGSADFTGKACAPDNSVHWIYDSYQMGASIGDAIPQLGKKWFMFSADYFFGRAMEEGVVGALTKNGATVLAVVWGRTEPV